MPGAIPVCPTHEAKWHALISNTGFSPARPYRSGRICKSTTVFLIFFLPVFLQGKASAAKFKEEMDAKKAADAAKNAETATKPAEAMVEPAVKPAEPTTAA